MQIAQFDQGVQSSLPLDTCLSSPLEMIVVVVVAVLLLYVHDKQLHVWSC